MFRREFVSGAGRPLPDDGVKKAATDMHLIVYTSESTSTGAAQLQALAEIVGASRRNNVRVGITGVMFHQNGRYLQLLEGPEQALRTLMTRIAADARHRDMQLLFDQSIHERGFPDWSMDVFEVNENASIGLDVLTAIRDGYESNFRSARLRLSPCLKA